MKRKQLESTPPEQEPEAERLQTEQFRLLQETATTASQYRDSGHVEPMQRQSPRRQSVEPDPYVSHSTAGDLAAAAGAYQLSLQHEAPEHLPFDQPATSPDRDQQQQMSQLLADQTYASIALGSTELGQRAYQDSLAEPCIPSSRSSRKSRAAAVPVGAFPCQCCKKARHFETLEALEKHRSEKQYGCLYCHNRFKNKNEAERHQNSLHRRLHSWSCVPLSADSTLAFFPVGVQPSPQGHQSQLLQPSLLGAATADFCGFCGDEFTNVPAPDWTDREDHLTLHHKFGECNLSKKFFRADHFRQHLKHSHGGRNGKHTNNLEQVCVRDEPSDDPLQSPSSPGLEDPQHPTPPSALSMSLRGLLAGAPLANMGELTALEQLDMASLMKQQQPSLYAPHDPPPLDPHQASLLSPSSPPPQPPPPPLSTSKKRAKHVSMDMNNIDPNIKSEVSSHSLLAVGD